MSEPILDPAYWRKRLQKAEERHLAIFQCSPERWKTIAQRHKKILQKTIGPEDSILDAGCGWGRLLDLLPRHWNGHYFGIDLSPDFIKLARKEHPTRCFAVKNLTDLPERFEIGSPLKYRWAVLISIRQMVVANLGGAVWDKIENNLRAICEQLLYLEYDENNKGSIE